MSFASIIMGEFPSGQRGQTVNLLAMLSVVRIHLPPFLFSYKLTSRGRAVRKLVGLITRRSQVQILPPLLSPGSSVGRAADWKSACHWFDSGSGHFRLSDEDGILAQLVEHLTFNQVVGGSNPPCLILKIAQTMCLSDFFYTRVIFWNVYGIRK